MRRTRNQKGFTIMELMVVIVIIGILIAIAIPAYNNFRLRAQTAACHANVRTVKTAVGIYYVDNGSYPTETQLTGGGIPEDGDPAYLEVMPSCPTTGSISIDGDTGAVACSVHDAAPATP